MHSLSTARERERRKKLATNTRAELRTHCACCPNLIRMARKTPFITPAKGGGNTMQGLKYFAIWRGRECTDMLLHRRTTHPIASQFTSSHSLPKYLPSPRFHASLPSSAPLTAPVYSQFSKALAVIESGDRTIEKTQNQRAERAAETRQTSRQDCRERPSVFQEPSVRQVNTRKRDQAKMVTVVGNKEPASAFFDSTTDLSLLADAIDSPPVMREDRPERAIAGLQP